MTRSVAIVGSNGKSGRAVAAALMEAGVEVRGVRRANANLHTGEGLAQAFDDCSAVYHLAPNLHPLEVLIAANVIAAAKHAGVERIVYHSVLQPQISEMPHHVAKARAEELIINSGLDWAILQPSAYAQNLNESVVGALPYSASAPFSFVDLRDVALAAVRLITDEITTFGTFEACGPITSVKEVSAALGWQCTESGLAHWRESHGTLPKYQFDALTAMFAYYNEHGLVGSRFTLTELLSREPVHAIGALRR